MKLFADNKLTKKELRKEFCSMAKHLGVKRVVFNNKSKHVSGTYSALTNNIFIDSKQSRRSMLLTFFHELGHFTAVQDNKWMLYHLNAGTPLISGTKKFDIENKIDKIARQLWNKYVSPKAWGKYKYGYPRTQKQQLSSWLGEY